MPKRSARLYFSCVNFALSLFFSSFLGLLSTVESAVTSSSVGMGRPSASPVASAWAVFPHAQEACSEVQHASIAHAACE